MTEREKEIFKASTHDSCMHHHHWGNFETSPKISNSKNNLSELFYDQRRKMQDFKRANFFLLFED